MSRPVSSAAKKFEQKADVFAALGEPHRLFLVTKLSDGKPQSITSLALGSKVSRQAITKHLVVLESVGLVAKDKE